MYLNVFYVDIEDFLVIKKLNVDDDICVKILLMGVVIFDKFMELVRDNKDMWLFYLYIVFE